MKQAPATSAVNLAASAQSRRLRPLQAARSKRSTDPTAKKHSHGQERFAVFLERSAKIAAPEPASGARGPKLEPSDRTGGEHRLDAVFCENLALEPSFGSLPLSPNTELMPLGTSNAATSSAPNERPDANLGAMFEQFVSAVRVGKQGDMACVSLKLDVGGGVPIEVMIEESAMGPVIDVQSDNPVQALALERELSNARAWQNAT